jgi:hypothetical protein
VNGLRVSQLYFHPMIEGSIQTTTRVKSSSCFLDLLISVRFYLESSMVIGKDLQNQDVNLKVSQMPVFLRKFCFLRCLVPFKTHDNHEIGFPYDLPLYTDFPHRYLS